MESKECNGALLAGPIIETRNVITGEQLGCLPENRERLLQLAEMYRLRRHEDGWFVDGSRHRAQIWEYGPGRLGVTVTGRRLVAKCGRIEWLAKRGIGDEEANFNCLWDLEHLKRLEQLLRLQRRRPPPASRPINPHTGRFEAQTMLPSVQPLTPA